MSVLLALVKLVKRQDCESAYTSAPPPVRSRRVVTVAFISDRVFPYFKGGAEKRYWEIARRLTAAGFEIHFYTGQWPAMPKETVIDGIFVHGVYRVRQFYVNGRKSIRESILYMIKILPYLLTKQYDIIDCEQFPLISILSSKLASVVRQKPLVVTWHEVWGCDLWIRYLGLLGRLGACIERIVVHLADHLISVSPRTTRNLRHMYGIPSRKITTIPNGIDPGWDRRAIVSQRAALGWEDWAGCDRRSLTEHSDIIYVGRLLKHKNVDMLLRVVAFVRRSNPSIRCLIVGEGPEKEALERMTRELGLDQNIRFLGSVENDRQVYALIRSSRVFVLPSRREGFGITVAEANACGVPVLVVDHEHNGACDLIKDGINGYICEFSCAEIGHRVLEILNKPAPDFARSCLGEAQRYSWDLVGIEVGAIYRKMLSEVGTSVVPAS